MTINKFLGKTKEEAIENAKKEMGESAVIMNVKEIKPKGIFSFFKGTSYEVTAALEEKETPVTPFHALQSQKMLHDNINLAADEKIEIPRPVRQEEKKEKTQDIEKRLDDLSNMLEKKLGETPIKQTDNEKMEKLEKISRANSSEELEFVRILYNTLLNNEVNEKYVNQIVEEVEKFIRPGSSVDVILSNVYQKMILLFGRPEPIALSAKKPKVVFFIGPTGVGKTTTIAKIASKYKVEQNRKVAFITADTYRIAATEQLRVYANILDSPMSIVYSADELNSAVEKMADYDLIFVDTAGFSHKNSEQKKDTKDLICGLDEKYAKEVYLVLSATTKYKDLLEIVDIYSSISAFNLIFTKLDETSAYGNILNVKLYSGAELSYVTNGQNVPDDIELFDSQRIVKQLLGGK